MALIEGFRARKSQSVDYLIIKKHEFYRVRMFSRPVERTIWELKITRVNH